MTESDTGDVLGLIPARGGSKGIPKKNIKPLGERPLIAYTIDAALDAVSVDRTIVSTDSPEIRRVADEHGADTPFLRPDELATDEAPTAPVVEHAIEYLENERAETYETIVLLQPTSPLRTAKHIDEAVAQLRETKSDSLVSVSSDHSYRWERGEDGASRKNYRGDRKRRQDKSPEFVENGAIYIVRTDPFMDTGDLQAGRTALYVMDDEVSVDIDEPFDLWLAERLMEWRQDKEV